MNNSTLLMPEGNATFQLGIKRFFNKPVSLVMILILPVILLLSGSLKAQFSTVSGLPIAYWDFELNSNRTLQELTPEIAVNTGNTFDGKFGSTTTLSTSAGHGVFYGGTAAGTTAGNAVSAGFFQATGSTDPGTGATTYFQFSLNTTGFTGISGFLDLYAGNTAGNYPDAGMLYSVNGGVNYIALGTIATTNGGWTSGIKYTLPATADNNPNVKIRVYGYYSNNTANNILRMDNFSVFATAMAAGAGSKTLGSESAFYTGTTSGVTGSQWIRYGTFNITSGSTLVLGTGGIALGSTTVAGAVTVANGGTLDCGGSASQVIFAGQASALSVFTINAGGSLIIRDAGGIASSGATGNIQTTTRSFSAGGNYTYANPAGLGQSTGTGLPVTLSGNLILNTPASITLSQATTIAAPGTLTLTAGKLVTTTTNILSIGNIATAAISGGSAASYISGPLNRTLPAGLSSSGSVYNFPVGSGSTYLPYSIANINTGATAPVLQVSAFAANAGGTPDNSTVSSLSTTEYWQTKVISGNYSGASLSLTRPTAVGPAYNVIAKGTSTTSPATTYVTLNGTPSGNSVNNSNQTGVIAAGASQFNLFARSSFNIVSSAGANGFITPAGTTNVTNGNNQTYNIVPDPCYHIADVLVDGASVGAVSSYIFTNVTATHTISASFSLNTYTATVNSGANGTVTPGSATVNCGSTNTYTITPDACYHITDVTLNGVSQGAVSTLDVNYVTVNYTVAATFAINTYTITATNGSNGSVTPAGASVVNCGGNNTYTITPDACYSIADVLVDGVSVGAVATYTFLNVTGNHTISATFVVNGPFTITATSGANGSVTPNGASNINCGNNTTYSITPDACYTIADVLVDGSSVGAVGTYTFSNVTANHTISATFVVNGPFTVTATSGSNGTVTPAGATSVNCGDNASYTITPDACYSIADVLVDGVSVGAVGTYTFTNVTANHTISATFSLNSFAITATSGANGSVTPAGATTVNCGDNATYTITPNACYSIADVLVDGVSVGAVGTYTFTNVTANHTISASFAINTYTITTTSGANGSVTPAGATTVNCADNSTYTITPDACYSIADVLVDGVSVGAVGTYTFTSVTANHTISATFTLNIFTITATSGANGSVTPAGASTINCGDNATYTITPAACYAIADVLVDGVSVGAAGTYTFTNVTANHTISASFVVTTYTINASAGTGGTIMPGTGSVNCGDNATYTITADACYDIADVVVDGVSQGAVGTYTFTNVTANHTISATFTQITYTITVTSGANGSVTPGTGAVNCGSNATYTITPAACYHVQDVLVDGVSAGAVTTYTFTNVTATHTISASFAGNAPATSPVVSGPVNVCIYIGTGAQVTYTASSTGATGYTWVLPPAGNVTIISGQGTANLTVTFQSGFAAQPNKQLKVTATSPCGNSSQVIYYLLAQSPPTPQPITGNNLVCAILGTGNTYTYYIHPVANATSYQWSAQSGTTTITDANGGPTPTDTAVNVSFANGFTTSTITVASVNGCGTSGVRTFTINRVNPSQPSPITGPTNACPYMAPGGAVATYSIPAVANAVTYNWTVPANAIGLTGQGTTSISFTYPSTFTSGTVSVTATNGCGTSVARNLSINKLNPATPSPIDVIQTAPCPDRVYTYTISAMPSNSTSLQWTVPAVAMIVSGQGSTSITVSYPATAVNGTVTVQAFNNCGNSSIRSVTIKLPACADAPPPPPFGRTKAAGSSTTAGLTEVKVFPNPSVSDFKLQVITAGKEQISVRILDLQGREFKRFIVQPYQATTIGSDLKAGAYILEVRQGGEVKTTKLIKF